MEEEERARGEGKQGVFLATTISAIATAAGVCNNRKMRGRISKERGTMGKRGGGELKKTQQEEFFLIVEQLPAGQCSAHNGQLFNLGGKQAAGEEGGSDSCIHATQQDTIQDIQKTQQDKIQNIQKRKQTLQKTGDTEQNLFTKVSKKAHKRHSTVQNIF